MTTANNPTTKPIDTLDKYPSQPQPDLFEPEKIGDFIIGNPSSVLYPL